jgi:hypothetical protein
MIFYCARSTRAFSGRALREHRRSSGSIHIPLALFSRWGVGSIHEHAVYAREGIMEVFLIVLAVLAAGALLVYFLMSPWGMQVVHNKTVSTILSDVYAMQSSAPLTPRHDIYYSLAEERANKSKWLIEFNYLYKLRDVGCFDERTAPEPEQFAEVMANVEEKIRLHASGVNT